MGVRPYAAAYLAVSREEVEEGLGAHWNSLGLQVRSWLLCFALPAAALPLPLSLCLAALVGLAGERALLFFCGSGVTHVCLSAAGGPSVQFVEREPCAPLRLDGS